jgi:DNA invertase Pin-like site-specific DNA recombinase
LDQTAGFEAQRRDLEAAGCKKIFAEQVSSVAEREQLKAAIDYLREDDVLVATKLDRLARSMRHLLDIVEQVKQKKASLRVFGMNLDTDTATGRMMLQVLGAVAEHDRASMLERQREGIAKAKAEVQGPSADRHGQGWRSREAPGRWREPDGGRP